LLQKSNPGVKGICEFESTIHLSTVKVAVSPSDKGGKQMKGLREMWGGEVSCPHCGKVARVKLRKETIVPAVPAETKIVVEVEKGTQTTLSS